MKLSEDIYIKFAFHTLTNANSIVNLFCTIIFIIS